MKTSDLILLKGSREHHYANGTEQFAAYCHLK